MSKNTNISELINYLSYDGSGNIVFTTVSAAATNTDKFLVSDAGTLKFRTAAQLLSDIGAQASGSYQAALSGTGFVKISGSTISYDNSTYATQTYVGTAISNLVASSPATLDTLNELALALGSDPNFATTVATSIGTKQAQLNGTGFVKVSGTTVSYDNSTYLTTASAASTYLPLAGGTLTGALGGTSATFTGDINSSNGKFYVVNTYGYYFGSSSNLTGFTGSNGTQTITVVTNGSTAISIASNQYVTLSAALSGTSATFSGDITSGGASQNLFIANGNTYSGFKLSRAGVQKWAIFNNNAGTDFLDIYNYQTSSSSFVINSSGNVGIGTTSPQSILSLAANNTISVATVDGSDNGYIGFSGGGAAGQGRGGHIILSGNDRATYGGQVDIATGDAATAEIKLYTAGSPRMTIQNGGNVGIGTTGPDAKFHVVGTNQFVTFEDTSTAVNGYAQILLKAGSADNYIWTANQNSTSWGGASSLNIYTATGNMAFFTAAVERMRITSTGNVGIGRTNPSTWLELNSTAVGGYFSEGLKINRGEGFTTQYGILNSYANSGFNLIAVLEGGGSGGTINFMRHNAGSGTPTSSMVITGAGNVGIGFTPSYKLQVAGEITTHAGTNTSYYAYMNYIGTTYNFGNTESTDNVDFKIAGGGTFTSGGNFRWFTQTGGGTPVERVRIGNNGLKFQNGASSLNYYEEGSFTPTNVGSNMAAVTAGFGKYVRIGNQVTVNARWVVSPGGTGQKYFVFHLPFAFAISSSIGYTGAVSNYNNGLSAYSSNVGTTVRNSSGSDTQQYVEAVFTTNADTTMHFSMTYFTF